MSADRLEAITGAAARRRGGRPARLTAAEVVDAAIEVADDQGLDGLSMPKLARHLGVGTMTVYGYVDNKQDLLDKMAARIFEGLTVTEGDDWQLSLTTFFSDFREAALAHPTLAGLLASGRITIPAVFDILEAFLQKTTDDGMSITEAVRLFYTALTYTIGYVLWEIPRAHHQTEIEYANQWADLLSQLDPTEYPLVTGPGSATLPTVASSGQFHAGLNRIISA